MPERRRKKADSSHRHWLFFGMQDSEFPCRHLNMASPHPSSPEGQRLLVTQDQAAITQVRRGESVLSLCPPHPSLKSPETFRDWSQANWGVFMPPFKDQLSVRQSISPRRIDIMTLCLTSWKPSVSPPGCPFKFVSCNSQAPEMKGKPKLQVCPCCNTQVWLQFTQANPS